MKRRIELNYGFVQGTYWICSCCLSGFTAIYLAYKGFNDSIVGSVVSLIAFASILLQLLISKFSDTHPNISLKKIILSMYMITMLSCVFFHYISPIKALTLILFVVALTFNGSAYGLINALYVRYTKAGYDVDYGWPRGFGSIGYAVIAYVMGLLLEKYDSGILMTMYLIFSVFSFISLLMMPNVEVKAEKQVQQKGYIEILKGNKVLTIFLLASILSAISTSGAGTFLIRIIENVGKGTTELGIAMLIQAGAEIPVMFTSALIIKKFRSGSLLTVSLTANLVKVVCLCFATNMFMIYLCMAMSVLCYGIYGFASVYFINEIVKEDETVRGQSLVTLCYNNGIGTIIGGFLSGNLIALFGLKSMLLISSCIGVLAVCLMFYGRKLYINNNFVA